MIRIYQKGQTLVTKVPLPISFDDIEDLIWIDLQDPSLEEITTVEEYFHINIPTRLQQEEIESSSRYVENDNYIVANSTFLQSLDDATFLEIHVSFLLKGDLLVTYREGSLRSFIECVKKIKTNHKPFVNGRMILLSLLETRIDFDADLVESISRRITGITKDLTNEQRPNEKLLKLITNYQETTMQLRENVIDKQRVVSSLLRSGEFADEEKERLRTAVKDINSLIEHSNFIFERLEYLQNTFLGLVNIDQNKIIKIFTVVSVIFMPPTLIASLYGMNFKFIPELNWTHGYPFALLLMLGSSLLTLWVFKRKRWL
jgi:magnesium transporter